MNLRKDKCKGLEVLRLLATLMIIVSLTGCEAFVRKFTRKPKQENLPREEMVLVPEEYTGPNLTREELYRHYFLYWESWHDELITALTTHELNHKKQAGCAEETVKNLQRVRSLLNPAAQQKLDVHLTKLNNLKASIATDTYGTKASVHRSSAERIKRDILRDFSYRKVKDSLL